MARYKLGVFTKKEGRVIDLNKITKLEKLEQLDNFLTAFENETQLKIYLFNQGLITNEEVNHNIKIMYKYNGKVKTIPVIYEEMKDYLDMDYLRNQLYALSSSGDIVFLEKLANFYDNGSTKFNKQGLNVSDIRNYLSDVRKNNGETFYSKMLEVAIEDLFKKAIFKDINELTGEAKEDYRGLRDLALFIYKYQTKQKEEKNNSSDKNNGLEDNWYQPSILDYVTKNEEVKTPVLSSDGEPDFPPNSEEEAIYKEYQEKLTESADENIDPYDEFYGIKRR